jgi:poly(beta-D-mannuronate) lyase
VSIQSTVAPPFIPPIIRIEGENFYSDKKGSVVDPDKLDRHFQLTLPLRNFVYEASGRADSADADDRECALIMMLEWADAGAMTEQPSSFIGRRERQRYTIVLNIIALKLQAAGLDIAPLLGWLAELNDAVIGDFAKLENVGNLYVWSGVCAASFAVLGGDDISSRYESKVWRHSLQLIREDGYVASEMARGALALSYHVYYLSALLSLRAFRDTLGKLTGDEEEASLARLIAFVGRALHDPSAIGIMSGISAQEEIPIRHFAPIVAFGANLLQPEILSGIPTETPRTDALVGGDLLHTAAILAHSHRR